MKILQVCGMFSSGTRIGGPASVVYQLSEGLMQREHKVTIYTSDVGLDSAAAYEYINSLQAVEVHPFHSWLDLLGFHFTPAVVGKAKKELKDFDIIHLHVYRGFQNIIICHYARKYGVPYVLDAHGSVPKLYRKGRKWIFDVAFGYKMLRGASKVIAETELGVNEYKELGINQDKILQIAPGFNVEEFSQLPSYGHFRSKFNIKEKHMVLFLGRVHWIKGVDFIVESFYELTKCRSDVILVIAGSNFWLNKPTLEDLIDKLNLSSRVLFTGFLSVEDKLSALVDANVVVQTSIYEQGIALTSIEAILCNTPIIVSKNTGAGEDVEKMDGGYLVEFGNKDELRNTIQKILNNPAEAERKTQKAKDYIKANLSLERKVVEFEKLYANCIEENKLVMGRKKMNIR